MGVHDLMADARRVIADRNGFDPSNAPRRHTSVDWAGLTLQAQAAEGRCEKVSKPHGLL